MGDASAVKAAQAQPEPTVFVRAIMNLAYVSVWIGLSGTVIL